MSVNIYNSTTGVLTPIAGVPATKLSRLSANEAVKEANSTASTAYNIGDYIVRDDDNLYKVIAEVAQGDTWTIGTNIEQASLGEEISKGFNELNSNLFKNIELSDEATQAYAVDDYVYYVDADGVKRFAKVTSAIAIGDTIEDGVNVDNTTLDQDAGGGGGASAFEDLTDVNINNLQNNQVPQWNSTSEKWENTTMAINGVNLSGDKTSRQLNIKQFQPITWDDYQNLTSEQKMDDYIEYIITDRDMNSSSIDDDTTSKHSVWSSKKTSDEIDNCIKYESWNPKTWTGLTSFAGNYIWTDGENIYYSQNTKHYILDKSTNTWSPKTWTGLTSFAGFQVWTDGENIYYSYNSVQYVLNKSTSTWSPKTWTGLTSFTGGNIWTDGENIYCTTFNSDNYILDKSTSAWNPKTWSGYAPWSGTSMWTDGEDIYLSAGSDQYVLDKSTSTWNPKTWNGLTNFYGNNIWTDGENIYYSNDTKQYILDKSTSTWNSKTWAGYTSIYGPDTWTDGENTYYSSYSDQYVLAKISKDIQDLQDQVDTNTNDISTLNSALATKADKTDITPQLYTCVMYGVNYQLAIIGRIAILSAYSGSLNRALNAYDVLVTLGAFDSSLNGKKFSIATQTLCTTNTGIRVGMDVNTQNTSTYSAAANGSSLRFTLTGIIG